MACVFTPGNKRVVHIARAVVGNEIEFDLFVFQPFEIFLTHHSAVV